MFFSFFCSLIHILICDIGFHFFHSRLKSWNTQWNNFDYNFEAERRASKQPPLLFSMYTPHRRRQRRAAPLHFTVLFHSVAARQVPPKRRFFLFFSFLLLRRRRYSCWRATLPMGARGGTCVIDAPRRCGGSVFCTSYLYNNRLYIMNYWEKETYM